MAKTQQQAELSESSIHSDGPALLFSMGDYSFYPMEVCSEDQIASLFAQVSQRGNPVLRGRPAADLDLLGRAMYQKTMLLRTGLVVLHTGKPVALSCNWDAAAGGAWVGSGLAVPPSLLAHAAIGNAAFASLPERSGSTFCCAFSGVLHPHPGGIFGVFALAGFLVAKEMGFENTFQFTLLPTMLKRDLFGASQGGESWGIKFADVPTSEVAVSHELTEMGGTCNCSVMTSEYATSSEYVRQGAGVVGMDPDVMLAHSLAIASQHVKFLRGNQTEITTSRL